jgi:hypothetical protein
MQNASFSVDPLNEKEKVVPSWRQRHRLSLQLAALGLGALALFTLIFSLQNVQSTTAGIIFALLGAGFNIAAWAG